MLPRDYKAKKYGEFWKLPVGEYKIQIYFNRSIPFPVDGISLQDILDKIVKPVFDSFNKLNFGITFVIDGWSYTDNIDTSMFPKQSIVYQYHLGSMALSHKAILLQMNLQENADTEGRINTLQHEIIHALGFHHKKGILKDYTPLYDSVEELNDDDIHGIDVIYNHPTEQIIKGSLAPEMNIREAEAYIVSPKKRLKYQSPVDPAGYFEFRLRKILHEGSKLMVIVRDTDDTLWFKIKRIRDYVVIDKLLKIDSFDELPVNLD
ncbi:MAG: hypothetical protein CV087_19090 [Candidatus Brocadia sp. WS118]|nr:MAG: hypothetical protein CV087_19090 [Candidatus Brocadia sp. WS118]